MKTKIIIGSLLAALAVAPAADASVRSLQGGFDGDANATITMDVVSRHGVPVKATNVGVTDLDYACSASGAVGEESVFVGTASIFPSARRGRFEFTTEVTEGGVSWVIGGLLRRSVRSVQGGAAYVFGGSSGTCESSAAGVGLFVAR